MEKTISVRRTTITFSIWDLGGQREFVNMLPLVCNDAVAILFMFDLSRKSTLNSVKEWYRQSRGFNKVRLFLPCLVFLSCGANPERRNRPRFHFSSAPSLIPSRRFRATSKRRSRSRPSASPRRCTRLSSFVRHPRPSTCKRSSKSCSQRHLTSNASFRRSRESASLYCSTSMCECTTGWTVHLVHLVHRIRADCTIHIPPAILSGIDATSFCAWVLWTPPVSPRCHLTWLRLHPLYISSFVRPCIRRRFDPLLLLLHITFLIGPSLYYHSTHRNFRLYPYPYSRPYIGPAFSLFYHFGGTHVDATHAR